MAHVPSSPDARDDALFEQIVKKRKRKKRRRVLTILIILTVILVGSFFGVRYFKRYVAENYAKTDGFITTFEAVTGAINTTVSGTGTLTDVDVETISVPAGVEILDIVVDPNDTIREGDVIATIHLPSVMKAMADIQSQLGELDGKIRAASDDSVASFVDAPVSGRVKAMFAVEEDDVISVMAEHGALALISLDGYMAADVATDRLSSGEAVTVLRADGKELTGTVESCTAGKAVILVTDDGPELNEEVRILQNGELLGASQLYIHCPLRVTAVSGTVSYRYPVNGDRINQWGHMYSLKDTDYSANYDTLLRQRAKLEDTLLELVELYRSGAVLAPFSGSVLSVEYGEKADAAAAAAESGASGSSAAGSGLSGLSGLSSFGSSYASMFASMSGVGSGAAKAADTSTVSLIRLAPDRQMMLSISIDEKDILSIARGQLAAVTVSSISDTAFRGEVTKVSNSAVSSSGVTKYTAEITLDKVPPMLTGMSASAKIRVEGVSNAVLIPVQALNQTSDTAYIYTGYDAELGDFTGLTEVTTGLSNGSYIEITSGLKEGDPVCYSRTLADMYYSRRSGQESFADEFAFVSAETQEP